MTFHFKKRIPYRLQLVRRQRFGQIDAADFRTDMQRQGNDLDGLWCVATGGRLTLRDHCAILLDRQCC